MQNQNSCCFVSRVNTISPIEGADKIELLKVEGWTCVSQKGSYSIGDLVIVATTDAMIPEQLADSLEVTTYLRNKSRVRTVKLRGVYSECLLIPPTIIDKVIVEGEDLMETLGIFKYEPQSRELITSSGRKIKYKDNQNFLIYHKFPNIKNVKKMFNEDDIVEITRKIHGCFQGNTLISMGDGTKKKIKDIIIGDEVLGFDLEKNIYVKNKVLQLFDNGKTKEWLKITTSRTSSLGNNTKNVTCTKNHNFYTKDRGYLEAEKLKVGDKVVSYIKSLKLTEIQKSILVGKMLGDGSLHKAKSNNFGIAYSHSVKQIEYIKYCNLVLGDISTNTIDTQISGYGSDMFRANTRFLHDITKNFSEWIDKEGKKQVPENLVLDPISLSFWYMDDGSLSHTDFQKDRALFSTNGFNEKSIDVLLRELKKYGIKGVKYNSNGWRIRLNKDDAELFYVLIREHVPEVMQYKLPEYHRGFFKSLEEQKNKETIYFEIEEKVLGISNGYNINMNTKKYDFQTDTHNYFASEILVHNSNARFGIVKKSKISFLDKVKKFFGLADEWIEYDFIYGSHNVEKGSDSQGFYSTDVWRTVAEENKIKENLWNLIKRSYEKEEIGSGMILYGEIYGQGIQKNYEYGLKTKEIRIFDVVLNGEYVNQMYAKYLTEVLCLEYVEILHFGPWSQEVQDKFVFDNFISGTKIPHEGIVVKIISGDRKKVAKVINPEYIIFAEKKEVGDSH